MEVSGQLTVPAALRTEKCPRTDYIWGWVGLRADLGAVKMETG
jgi:hypothetical protein